MQDAKIKVRAVERALDILLCFTEQPEWSLTEIADKVALHKSTVHRLLASLEGKGFILRDSGTEKYRIGIRIWELAANLSHPDDPAMILLPEMERLRDLLGETISLYILDGTERIRIQAVQSKQPLRRVAPVGVRLPLYVGASSKILIAYSAPEVRQNIMRSADWPAAMDVRAFDARIEQAKERGYATSIEERELGVTAVAAPVIDRAGRLVAALSVSGPASRWTEDQLKRHAPTVMEAAKRMSRMMK